jgi:hypothetical protein
MAEVLKAYFYTSAEAEKAAVRLGTLYKVTHPEPVMPVQSRPWRVEITIPSSSQSLFPNPTFVNAVVGVVLGLNGIVHTQDQA